MVTIKREAAIATVSGIIGALASNGVNVFSKNLFSNSLPAVVVNFAGFALFFIVLLFAANFLFQRIDARTNLESKKVEMEKTTIEQFREMIVDMYRGFPKYVYTEEQIESQITPEVRKILIKERILTKHHNLIINGQRYSYMLGPNALQLVSGWKTEDMTRATVSLTNKVVLLTWLLFLATVFLLAWTIFHDFIVAL